MKLQLESTTKIVQLHTETGMVPARVWEGVTEKGIEIHAYVTFIACALDADAEEFERDLQEQRTPSPAVVALPMGLIL